MLGVLRVTVLGLPVGNLLSILGLPVRCLGGLLALLSGSAELAGVVFQLLSLVVLVAGRILRHDKLLVDRVPKGE